MIAVVLIVFAVAVADIALALLVAGWIGRGSAKPVPVPPRTWIRAL